MSRANPPRGEGSPTGPHPSSEPPRFEVWLAVALCAVVLLASTAILERTRSFSRALIEIEQARRTPLPSTEAEPTRPHRAQLVILLVLDGLRADCVRPGPESRLARFASESLRFENVLAQASESLAAHKALLTGCYPATLMLEATGDDVLELSTQRRPAEYLARVLARAGPELGEHFRAGGFRTAAFTVSDDLGQTAEAASGGERLEELAPNLDAALGRGLQWLERVRGRPAFLLVQAEELLSAVAPEAGDEGETRARYAECLGRLDQSLGAFLDGLRRRGQYESALIALTAAHGLALGEGGRFGHGGLHLEELLVPLLLKFPQEAELTPADRSEPVELVDLAPTLLAAAGCPLPGGMDGRALVPLGRRPERGRDCLQAELDFAAGRSSLTARAFVRPGRWHVVHDPVRGEASLVDLRADPVGLAPRALAVVDVPALLKRLLARGRPARPRLVPSEPPSAGLAQILADLGYAESAPAGSGAEPALR